MRLKKRPFLSFLRIAGLFVVGLAVAVVVTLSQINLEKLRGNVLTILQDATGMPVEIDGAVSWKLSLRPRIELNQVRVANEDWAKNKYAFDAKKIDVRLNLISLFRDRPTIQNVRIYDAKINIEKNSDGKYSVKKIGQENATSVPDEKIAKFPFKDAGLGGVEFRNLKMNILERKYSVAGFHIRLMPKKDVREYSGWIKSDTDVLPFIVSFAEYNADRKVYPVQVALSTGGDAIIANVALEGTSKMPIDFIVKGELAKPAELGAVLGLDWSGVPSVRLNVAGGVHRKKIVLRKSSLLVNRTEFVLSGSYDWNKKVPVINLELASQRVDLVTLFPNMYGRTYVKPKRPLNVFRDVPLFGTELVGKTINLRLNIDNFIVYRDLNFDGLHLAAHVNNNRARIDLNTGFAGGNFVFGTNADIDDDGRIWLEAAARGTKIYVGEILREVHQNDLISDLPINLDFYVRANGANLSEVMQTITGPVQVYSDGAGYAHSALVAYMYGTDFLTSLRHTIQDLFRSEKKYDQIKISCMALNAKLRDGVFETQNGFAIETNAINIRLAGSLDLGNEKMRLSLTTVPVRGLKLSLTGKVMNSVELNGSLAEPDIKISGAAMASKVASATGIGLLLAPFTGGIGLVAGTGVGLIAGDLLENWLADDEPCKTAMKRGAPLYREDPDWLGEPMSVLVGAVLGEQDK